MDAKNKLRALIFFFVFTAWSCLVFSFDFIGKMDQFVYHLFSQYQNPTWLHFNSVLTNLGSSWFILSFIFIVSLVFFITSKRKMEFAYFGFSATALILNLLTKNIFQRIRPENYVTNMSLTTYAYPSGHALGSVLLMGFLLCLIHSRGSRHPLHRQSRMEPPPHRAFGPVNLIYVKIIAILLCLWIAASRVFLGVHWLSDVVGGLLIGFFWLEVLGWLKPENGDPGLAAR